MSGSGAFSPPLERRILVDADKIATAARSLMEVHS